MKIEIFKKHNNFNKKSPNLDPVFYWKFVATIIFILIIIFFFFGYFTFTKVNQEQDLSTMGGGEKVPSVNKDRIGKILNYFSEREQKSKEILNSGASVVDPSL